jgi:hypothetical protein
VDGAEDCPPKSRMGKCCSIGIVTARLHKGYEFIGIRGR